MQHFAPPFKPIITFYIESYHCKYNFFLSNIDYYLQNIAQMK